ncbi:hypothetical protein [Parachitinimonas caeni]|uniref:Uncharacterized protein n=1 Tax=Parachitinimonas caeni TaxID=3031301 RepID=A0ABT7E1N1_9NEIS|nr:hypothetical protein [Parachitinimonas caeni]MDK2125320.1 hypothetical protein [Parachitinimonas caeni]
MASKLKLNKKTLRVLTEDEAQLVAGGALTDKETTPCPTDDCTDTCIEAFGGCGPGEDTMPCPSITLPSDACPTNITCETQVTCDCPV